MRNAKIMFFPVGNGDMTLVMTESGRWLLIDANIRTAADDPDDATPDVARLLRERLSHDADGRLYVDALLVTYPDKDHCTGLRKHFHLGPPDTWSDSADKIIIREIWSSPMVFRRASRRNVLCDDARAFNAEARRRVRLYRDAGGAVAAATPSSALTGGSANVATHVPLERPASIWTRAELTVVRAVDNLSSLSNDRYACTTATATNRRLSSRTNTA